MKSTSHLCLKVITICTVGATATFVHQSYAATITIESGLLGARGSLDHSSTFGSGSSSSTSWGANTILTEKTRGTGGAGAGYAFALGWNGSSGSNDTLEIYAPVAQPMHAFGYAVDAGGSEFSSESEIRNHGQPMSLRIDPSAGDVLGDPVLVQIEITLAGEMSAYGAGAAAEAHLWTASSAGPIVDSDWVTTDDVAPFYISASQEFQSTVGDALMLEFDHLIQVNGVYNGEACGAFAEIWQFSLSVTTQTVPEPSSLATLVLGAAWALRRR